MDSLDKAIRTVVAREAKNRNINILTAGILAGIPRGTMLLRIGLGNWYAEDLFKLARIFEIKTSELLTLVEQAEAID